MPNMAHTNSTSLECFGSSSYPYRNPQVLAGTLLSSEAQSDGVASHAYSGKSTWLTLLLALNTHS